VELVLAGHTHRQLTLQVGRITAMTSPVGYASQWHESTAYDVARERLKVVELA
jgi:hypothetical protein